MLQARKVLVCGFHENDGLGRRCQVGWTGHVLINKASNEKTINDRGPQMAGLPSYANSERHAVVDLRTPNQDRRPLSQCRIEVDVEVAGNQLTSWRYQ